MLLPPEMTECVAFLGVKMRRSGGGRRENVPAGTVCFVSVPNSPAPDVDYAVTTAHNILRCADGDAFLRFNTVAGGMLDVDVPNDSWEIHPTTDVAAVRIDCPAGCEYRVAGIETLAGEAHRNPLDLDLIGLGDPVFVIGLFAEHPGKERNRPIVRLGSIALMAGEPIRAQVGVDQWDEIVAHLIEIHSRGGHSGSPVFTYPRRGAPTTMFSVLGILQGHFKARPEQDYWLGDLGPVPKWTAENTGIGIVIPAAAIRELLSSRRLVQERSRLRRDWQRARSAVTQRRRGERRTGRER